VAEALGEGLIACMLARPEALGAILVDEGCRLFVEAL
jgi:hypothetical protein